MKTDDGKVADVRSRQGTRDKSFDGHNKWHNLDSRASDHVHTTSSYDSHHQPGWPSDRAKGYDNLASDHDYVNDADMNVAELSNRYGPYVQSKDRTRPTRSFDGHNEWHKSDSRTADHVDAARSYSHQETGWSSGKTRSIEGEHGLEEWGRKATGNIDSVQSLNQYHPGRSMGRYNAHFQPGLDHDNRDRKQVEVSSDSERQLVRSNGHHEGWNQNDRRAAEEKEHIRAASSATKAMGSIRSITNEANEDRSHHYHGEMGQNGRNQGESGRQGKLSASGSGIQQNADGAKTTEKTKTATRVEGQ